MLHHVAHNSARRQIVSARHERKGVPRAEFRTGGCVGLGRRLVCLDGGKQCTPKLFECSRGLAPVVVDTITAAEVDLLTHFFLELRNANFRNLDRGIKLRLARRERGAPRLGIIGKRCFAAKLWNLRELGLVHGDLGRDRIDRRAETINPGRAGAAVQQRSNFFANMVTIFRFPPGGEHNVGDKGTPGGIVRNFRCAINACYDR